MKARDNAIEAAQDILYVAWDSPSAEARVALAIKALQVSRDCADAYVLLAQESAESLDEQLALFELAIAAGARAVGRETFEKEVGHFWGILETRPYMRARHGAGITLQDMGRIDEAIEQFEELLRLNPSDNQGIRYLLSTCFLEAGRVADLERLLKEFDDDASAAWAYAKALVAFRRSGDTELTRRALANAVGRNPFVPEYLLGKKKMPRTLPDYISFGDESEAVSYAAENVKVWKKTPGAIAWMKKAVGR